MTSAAPTLEEGRLLPKIARRAVEEALALALPLHYSEPWLAAPAATFVTLTQAGDLRGCIGSLWPLRPLLEDLQKNAVAAAFSDPRFPRLQARELPRTRFEVSLLSPPERLPALGEEELLRHLAATHPGVILGWGPLRGTFLPQMWEKLPDPVQFLRHLQLKAGVPAHTEWREVQVWTYTVRTWADEN